MVNPTIAQVREVLGTCRIDLLQFHGDEKPDFVKAFPVDKVIKALGIKDRDSLKSLVPYKGVSTFLLDSWAPAAKGGTGKTFRWDIAKAAKKKGRNIVLAGGLTPANVAEAVASVRPWAVDTASGVEAKKGIKDIKKMRQFINNAKAA